MSHLYRVRHSTMGTSLWTACCLVSYGLLLFLNFVHSTKTKLICPPVDEYDCVMYCLYSESDELQFAQSSRSAFIDKVDFVLYPRSVCPQNSSQKFVLSDISCSMLGGLLSCTHNDIDGNCWPSVDTNVSTVDERQTKTRRCGAKN